jgi:DNA-binding XRE family transcriptional regulator
LDDGRVTWGDGFVGEELAPGDAILVETLRQRDHWGWADLRQAIVDAGLSEGFLSVNSQYSPLLMRVDHDMWCLRSDHRMEARGRGFVRLDASFGKQLREARLTSELSQRELGEKIGMAQPEISRWETGEEQVPKRRLSQLEVALNATFDLGSPPENVTPHQDLGTGLNDEGET